MSYGVFVAQDLPIFCGLAQALLPSFIVALFWAAAIFNRLVQYTSPFLCASQIGCRVGKYQFATTLVYIFLIALGLSSQPPIHVLNMEC